MKLGTSLRFLYPTGPQTYERFKEALATLPPGGFIERLDLLRPIYRRTTNYGHFGRPGLPWEE